MFKNTGHTETTHPIRHMQRAQGALADEDVQTRNIHICACNTYRRCSSRHWILCEKWQLHMCASNFLQCVHSQAFFHTGCIHFKLTHLMLAPFCCLLQIFRQSTDPQRDGHNRRNTVNVSYRENGCDQLLPPLYLQCHPSGVIFHQNSPFPFPFSKQLESTGLLR